MSTVVIALNNVTQEIASPDKVPNGKHCQCQCFLCGKPLVAKQGENTRSHFAHYPGESCITNESSSGSTSSSDYRKMYALHEITQKMIGFSEKKYGDHVLYQDDARTMELGKRAIYEIIATSPMSNEKLNYIEHCLYERGTNVFVINLRKIRTRLLNLITAPLGEEEFREKWIEAVSSTTMRLFTARSRRAAMISKLRKSGTESELRGRFIDKRWSPTEKYSALQYKDLSAWQKFCLDYGSATKTSASY